MGRPRLDAYERIIQRFYETLFLEKILAPAERNHVSIIEEPHGLQLIRRRFLRNLAYVCDYDKGGPSTTAIAIEDLHHSYNFWIGCNSNHSERILPFLRAVLQLLKESSHLGTVQDEDCANVLFKMCAIEAEGRLRKEARLLLNKVKKSLKHLKTVFPNQHIELATWLQQFDQEMGHSALCQLAYHARHSFRIEWLDSVGSGLMQSNDKDGARNNLAIVRHYVGRLSHHVRAPMQLVQDAHSLQGLFDSFEVRPVPILKSVAQPVSDSQTTPEGVLKRLLQAKDPRLPELIKCMSAMGIFEEFLLYYKPGKVHPEVHAELQVLEHFFTEELSYMDNDRYIGCSKPSCLCCKLYIRHHPARCVEPESHQKVYPNWGPPTLLRGREDPGYAQQRDILIKIHQDIRADVVEQISQRHKSRTYHEDSLTGISGSTTGIPFELSLE